eukprot:TRINITY_DN7496_c0_g1_i1.p1 TRINITY_DN7496_c0_g1~~TRINITY_DN7496_c0_g1_i1.p1  ORF type:complete len:197 (+),score=58.15 TRINITY_DN7496_c0_g1_i1:225-815(+)
MSLNILLRTTRAANAMNVLVPRCSIATKRVAVPKNYKQVQELLKRTGLLDEFQKLKEAKIDDEVLNKGLISDQLLKEAGVPPGARCKIAVSLPRKESKKTIFLCSKYDPENSIFQKQFKDQNHLQLFLLTERIPGLIPEGETLVSNRRGNQAPVLIDEYEQLEEGKKYFIDASAKLNQTYEDILQEARIKYETFMD